MTVIPHSSLDFVRLPGRRSANPFVDLEVPASVRLVRIEPDPDRRPHRHPHSIEVMYVVSGHGTAWQDGRRTPVGPGDTVLIPRGASHATLAAEGDTLELLCFFPHPDLADNLEELETPALGYG